VSKSDRRQLILEVSPPSLLPAISPHLKGGCNLYAMARSKVGSADSATHALLLVLADHAAKREGTAEVYA
jgi:hypothetical protein